MHGANEVQVRDRSGLDPARLTARWDRAVPRALKGRCRFPPFLRPVRIGFEAPLGKRPLGYLMDIVYTRDVWMHRIDICRATGRQPVLTAGHDGRLIADMVADWAATHHHPFSLRLTGPAGGSYTRAATARAWIPTPSTGPGPSPAAPAARACSPTPPAMNNRLGEEPFAQLSASGGDRCAPEFAFVVWPGIRIRLGGLPCSRL